MTVTSQAVAFEPIPTPSTIRRLQVSFTGTDAVIKSPSSGKIVKVLEAHLYASAACNISLQDGSTDCYGPVPLAGANGFLMDAPVGRPGIDCFICKARTSGTNDLNVHTSTAVTVTGHVVVYETDP